MQLSTGTSETCRSAILAARRNKKAISMDEINDATDRVIAGCSSFSAAVPSMPNDNSQVLVKSPAWSSMVPENGTSQQRLERIGRAEHHLFTTGLTDLDVSWKDHFDK